MQGSTVAVTDVNGNIQDTYSYDPYGNLLSSTGTVANPYRYDDGYYDVSTGLYKFGERYYNPSTMRWTQLDPSGQNPGYVFAGDDPVNFVDLSGTYSACFYDVVYGIGGGLFGVASGLFGIVTAETGFGLAAGIIGGNLGSGAAVIGYESAVNDC